MPKTATHIPPKPLFDTLQNIKMQISTEHPYPDDYQQARNFLYSYRGSEATYNAYRRELERLLDWCSHIAKKSLKQLRRNDIEQFVEFCQAPPSHWIGTKHVSRFIDKEGERLANADWRPFVAQISKAAGQQGKRVDPKKYALSQKALQALFAVLGSFYNYLIEEEYMDLNPVAQIRQKSKYLRKQQGTTPIRRLSELQWGYVIETTEKLADKYPEQHERTLFIMNILFSLYLRVSELAASVRWQPEMGDFHRDHDGNWWFTTIGKGNKQRDITVSDDMLKALRRYRRSLGLSALPYLGETTPLVPKFKGKGFVTSTRQIRSIVQNCFDAAFEKMMEDGMQEDAEQLRAASVHWLRHTGISEDVKHRPREHVRDDAGHGSSAITDQYIDDERRARHASGKKKLIKPSD